MAMVPCPVCSRPSEETLIVCPHCGDLRLIGRKIGTAIVLEQIGGGGFGVVYRARHPTLGERAIKILRPRAQSEMAVRQFEREARALSNLNHPNIVRVDDQGLIEGLWYMRIELLQGPGLDEVLRSRGHFPWQRTVTVGKQIAAGLDAAHATDIVHADLKPANVRFIDAKQTDDRVKLLDFGIARWVGAPSSPAPGGVTITADSSVGGFTYGYASPEQIVGAPLDGRSDLYSLGVVLYELLTGELPTVASDLRSRLNGRECPDGLVALVHSLLQPDPNDRPQDAPSVAAKLGELELVRINVKNDTFDVDWSGMLPAATTLEDLRIIVFDSRVTGQHRSAFDDRLGLEFFWIRGDDEARYWRPKTKVGKVLAEAGDKQPLDLRLWVHAPDVWKDGGPAGRAAPAGTRPARESGSTAEDAAIVAMRVAESLVTDRSFTHSARSSLVETTRQAVGSPIIGGTPITKNHGGDALLLTGVLLAGAQVALNALDQYFKIGDRVRAGRAKDGATRVEQEQESARLIEAALGRLQEKVLDEIVRIPHMTDALAGLVLKKIAIAAAETALELEAP